MFKGLIFKSMQRRN